MNNKKNISAITMLVLLLTGCKSQVDEVQQEMNRIRSTSPLAIQAAPVFTPVPTYDYAAQQFRNPFLPSSLALELQTMAGKRVFPNLNRQPQPLETFELEKLIMKGSLKDKMGQVLALIQTPDGQIERVQRGNYLGMNQGRIVNITPVQIDLIEIVPDGRDGYVERPRTLVLVGSGQQTERK